ncbi:MULTISPECIES: hypothetical protein [Thalassospira]|uniref:hypothetical protein n=1 Tax=Thalassospira TaxID=168934 RepID=UPI0011BE75EC|nr:MULTISPECIES: hypothetical protein [Thalassospira]
MNPNISTTRFKTRSLSASQSGLIRDIGKQLERSQNGNINIEYCRFCIFEELCKIVCPESGENVTKFDRIERKSRLRKTVFVGFSSAVAMSKGSKVDDYVTKVSPDALVVVGFL